MTKRLVLLAALLAFVGVPAWAETVIPVNVRPANVYTNAEQSLQQCLDAIYGVGVVSAAGDQEAAGMWGLPSNPDGITATLRFEFAANLNSFGIWTGTDTANILSYEVFSGPDSPIDFGHIDWYTPTSGLINSTTPFTGIPYTGFGFYIGGPDTSGFGRKFYTADSLNVVGEGGTPQVLAYLGPQGGLWTLAFEDVSTLVQRTGEPDYNDMIVTIESLVPVPEPGSLLLLGSGLIGLAGAVRRRLGK